VTAIDIVAAGIAESELSVTVGPAVETTAEAVALAESEPRVTLGAIVELIVEAAAAGVTDTLGNSRPNDENGAVEKGTELNIYKGPRLIGYCERLGERHGRVESLERVEIDLDRFDRCQVTRLVDLLDRGERGGGDCFREI